VRTARYANANKASRTKPRTSGTLYPFRLSGAEDVRDLRGLGGELAGRRGRQDARAHRRKEPPAADPATIRRGASIAVAWVFRHERLLHVGTLIMFQGMHP
jgi:hypothetical protein